MTSPPGSARSMRVKRTAELPAIQPTRKRLPPPTNFSSSIRGSMTRVRPPSSKARDQRLSSGTSLWSTFSRILTMAFSTEPERSTLGASVTGRSSYLLKLASASAGGGFQATVGLILVAQAEASRAAPSRQSSFVAPVRARAVVVVGLPQSVGRITAPPRGGATPAQAECGPSLPATPPPYGGQCISIGRILMRLRLRDRVGVVVFGCGVAGGGASGCALWGVGDGVAGGVVGGCEGALEVGDAVEEGGGGGGQGVVGAGDGLVEVAAAAVEVGEQEEVGGLVFPVGLAVGVHGFEGGGGTLAAAVGAERGVVVVEPGGAEEVVDGGGQVAGLGGALGAAAVDVGGGRFDEALEAVVDGPEARGVLHFLGIVQAQGVAGAAAAVLDAARKRAAHRLGRAQVQVGGAEGAGAGEQQDGVVGAAGGAGDGVVGVGGHGSLRVAWAGSSAAAVSGHETPEGRTVGGDPVGSAGAAGGRRLGAGDRRRCPGDQEVHPWAGSTRSSPPSASAAPRRRHPRRRPRSRRCPRRTRRRCPRRRPRHGPSRRRRCRWWTWWRTWNAAPRPRRRSSTGAPR